MLNKLFQMPPEKEVNYSIFMIYYPIVVAIFILTILNDGEPLYRNPDDMAEVLYIFLVLIHLLIFQLFVNCSTSLYPIYMLWKMIFILVKLLSLFNPFIVEQNACPKNLASFLSRLTFSWFDRYFSSANIFHLEN